VPAVGFRAQSAHERPVPVASMTKVMTAYVVLEDHPLALGQQGPRITITQADADQFGTDTVTDQANVLLKQGEVLTEYQMLEGLLVHSANDLAYALASWDAGSVPAFVAKMNRVAVVLGMHDTHFADASGFSPSSVSTAADLLRVGSVAMADPVFEQIVSMPAVALPLAGTVGSYTPMLGTTGVVGVKSGFTTAAGGGDLLAYRTTVDGHTFLSLAAVTSQEGWTVLGFAGREALALAKAASARVISMTAAPKGTVVARLTTGSRSVAVRTASAASLLVLPGGSIHQAVHLRSLRAGARRGTEVGTATFVFAGQVVSVPVRLAGRLP
jgi:D-alanyl-D-alanine carboxypeptidase (penicillin-binding protein 5/6)